MVTAEDVRRVAGSLPRAEEHLIRDHVKFRVGRLVFVSITPDERSMGFGFPKEERAALVASEPHKFHMPVPSDERYNWVRVWLDAIDQRRWRSWSWRRGAWSSPSGWPPPTRVPDPVGSEVGGRPNAGGLPGRPVEHVP